MTPVWPPSIAGSRPARMAPHPVEMDRAQFRSVKLNHPAICAGEGPLTLAANKVMQTSDEIIQRIMSTAAFTLDGLLVKFRAFQWCHGGEPFRPGSIDVDENSSTDMRILASLISDLATMGKVGA